MVTAMAMGRKRRKKHGGILIKEIKDFEPKDKKGPAN